MIGRWMLGTALGAAAVAAAGTSVRVARTDAGPRVLVDGQAMPLRCFFGSRAAGSLALGTDWQPFSFRFVPGHAVAATGTLHFRFDHRTADYGLRDVRIVETASGRDVLPRRSFDSAQGFADLWHVFPPGDRNTVGTVVPGQGSLAVQVREPANRSWPDLHLHSTIGLSFAADTAYEVRFEARASTPTALRPAVYTVENGTWLSLGGPTGPFERELALARDAGVRFVSTGMPACWGPPEQPVNWEALDAVMREVIAVHPRALVLPRVGADAPSWWLDRHPEARMQFEDGSKARVATVSSREYRQEAAAHLEKLCRHLTETFPEHFAGIHPCGQNTGEWFYEDSWGRLMSGGEPPTLAAWRDWLRRHGRAAAETATFPAAARRHAAANGVLREPASEADLIDANRFWQEEMADMVLALAAAARRGCGDGKLVVFFYGYLFEFPPLFNGAPYSGHYALAKVLACADVDVLCSPISYTDRQWLGTGPCMSPAESVALAGKLWLNEDDTRTYLARTTDYGGVADLAQTIAVLRRNTAQAAMRGFGTWWMDLPGTGWFDDPDIWQEHRRLVPLDTAMLSRRGPYAPEVALIVDEDSLCHLAGGSAAVARPLLYDARAAAGRCGAPYGQYLLRDAAAGRVPARLQIHLASWAVPAAVRAELRQNRRPGVTCVWAYAPGCIAIPGEAAGAAAVPLHGFRVQPAAAAGPARATPTAAGRALGITAAWGQTSTVRPRFTVATEPGDDVLATYDDGTPALVVRRRPEGNEVFAGTPAWTSEVMRALCRVAGVHLYTETDAWVWAAEGVLGVQAHDDSPLSLNTGAAAPVRDLLSGEVLGTGPLLRLPLRRGETRLLGFGPLP